MTFFDWWGFLGTGIQSMFAWMTFNRDGFADNVSWRQAQKYQQKNYNISWIAIARDDIRDMMGISVNRINNYMIVATLILSVAAGALMSVSFKEDCPGFIVYCFYLCTGISIIFLMLSIMFGVKGQNSAFTNTMKLLTYQVRPENPAEYSHDYMKQAQWLERNGLGALFRIPGIMPSYNTDAGKDTMKSLHEAVDMIESHPSSGNSPALHRAHKVLGKTKTEDLEINLEEATPLESLVMRTSHTWYLTKFAEFMRLWHPYDLYSKYSMGLGILCLGDSSAYFALGYLARQDYAFNEYAVTIVTLTFILMVALIINSTFRAPGTVLRILTVVMISLGPSCATLATVTSSQAAKQIFVPLAILAHFLLWVLVYYFALDLKESAIHFIKPGDGFFSKGKGHGGRPADLPPKDHDDWKKTEQKSHEDWRKARPRQKERAKQAYLEQSPCGRASALCGEAPIAPCAERRSIREAAEEGSEEAQHMSDHIGWPTDEDQFLSIAEATRFHIRSTAHSTILASAGLWLAMLLWAIMTYWFAPAEPRVYATMAQEQPQVIWPSDSFRPRLLACHRDLTVVSDGYQIFRLDPSGASVVRCPGLRGPIRDLSISCSEGCAPVALKANAVVHCGYGAMPLQDDLQHFTVLSGGSKNLTEQTLLALLVSNREEEQS
ncbi:unnamed protein product [Effrenium voratum]|uniref:Uncharacterized protein n=1 Tax=Effrenium voratum TaxID=2562239 RepID=A0AA36JGY0_9DINO|nr:unnamed protein product [Effrenium voratum]CAJ1429890.1 unnamed protein product [Effrenium voratum]